MGDEKRAEAAFRQLSEEMAAGRKTTVYNAADFLGNLGLSLGHLDNKTPDVIAAAVRFGIETHVPMFARMPGGAFLVQNGELIPLEGMVETFDVSFKDIERVYMAAQGPLDLTTLKELLEPLRVAVERFRATRNE